MQPNNTLSFSAIEDRFSTTQFPYRLAPHPPIADLEGLRAGTLDGLLTVREGQRGAYVWFPENPFRFPQTPLSAPFWERIRPQAPLIGHAAGDRIYIPPLAEPCRRPVDHHGPVRFALVPDLTPPHPDMAMDLCTPLAQAIGRFDAAPEAFPDAAPAGQGQGALLSLCAAQYLAAHETGVSWFVLPHAGIGFTLFGAAAEDPRAPAAIGADIAAVLASCLPPLALLAWSLENSYTPQSLACQVLARAANAALDAPQP